MPCSGPRMPLDSEIDEVTEDLMEYFKHTYGATVYDKTYGVGTATNPRYNPKNILRAAVQAILDTDAIESF